MLTGTAKETYRADQGLLSHRGQTLWMALFAAGLIALPFLGGAYTMYLACLVLINVAAATGLNILTGFTGLQYFRTMGIPLVEVYGATETSGMILGQRLAARVPGAVGEPVRGAEIRLSEAGEVLLHGDLVFQGYYRNPEATEATIRDGWLHTGDVGKLIDGQYAIVDRMKDIMITAGGKNLSPSEIENTVKASPYIKECVTIGEGRKFVSALIQIDYETVAKWAEEQGIAYTNFRSLAEHPSIRDLVGQEIDASNARMAQVARIRKFHLLTKELDHDDDEVTATMKVRRANVARKYAPDIEHLYTEPGSA